MQRVTATDLIADPEAPQLDELCDALAFRAQELDQSGGWPAEPCSDQSSWLVPSEEHNGPPGSRGGDRISILASVRADPTELRIQPTPQDRRTLDDLRPAVFTYHRDPTYGRITCRRDAQLPLRHLGSRSSARLPCDRIRPWSWHIPLRQAGKRQPRLRPHRTRPTGGRRMAIQLVRRSSVHDRRFHRDPERSSPSQPTTIRPPRRHRAPMGFPPGTNSRTNCRQAPPRRGPPKASDPEQQNRIGPTRERRLQDGSPAR